MILLFVYRQSDHRQQVCCTFTQLLSKHANIKFFKAVGHLQDERTGSRLHEVESYDSMSTGSPQSFSCLQDDMPQSLPHHSVICQGTIEYRVPNVYYFAGKVRIM